MLHVSCCTFVLLLLEGSEKGGSQIPRRALQKVLRRALRRWLSFKGERVLRRGS